MKFFHAVQQIEKVGDGTVGDLVDYLMQYINVLFPDNGIEYWADNRFANGKGLKRFQPVPSAGLEPDSIHHVACYVRQGPNEGRIIEVCLYLRNDTLKSLVWIKTFGDDDECWSIARAIDAALNGILYFNELPEMVTMSGKLPRQENWYRKTSLTEEVTVTAGPASLRVATTSGLVFDDRNWSEQGVNAKFYVEAYLTDWQTVLQNLKARFTVCDNRALPAA
jgi:hypothetical protein